MNRTRKLSLLIAVVMLLQLGVPGWLPAASVEAAPSGPLDVSFFPADNMTNVPLRTNLRIIFDENVRAGASSANINIYRSSNNSLVESISATSSRVSISSSDRREVTITPSLSSTNSRFEPNTEYYILIDAGAFVNVSNGAAYAGIQNATRWNFRTAAAEDTTRPLHTARTPEGTGAPITSSLSITFDKPVYAASGSITLSSVDDTRFIPVTSASVTGSGTTQITIVPEGALLPTTQYTVTIANGSFQDASGNGFLGTSWTFTTAAAPVNLSASAPFTPADNSSQVAVDTNLVIRFDQNVQANSGRYIEIRRVSDNVAVHRIQATDTSRITVAGNMATIDPPSNLAANTAYYVLIDPGAFSQPAPNTNQWFYGISAATIWNFTTGYGNDTTPPSLQTRVPAHNGRANSVNTLLTLTFNEEVFPNSGNIEIRQSVGGTLFRSIPITSPRVKGGGSNQLVIDATSHISAADPAKPFLNNTQYYVTIGNRAIRDGAGNFFAGISGTGGWVFTVTQDGTRPQLLSLSPANGATAVGLQHSFTAAFDKPVAAGSGSITFIPESTSGSVSSVPAVFEVDRDNNRQIVIRPSTALQPNTRYYINIAEGAITDLVGNAFVGILNQHQWTFQTLGGDTTPPSLTKSEVSGSVIRLIYNEPLNAELKPSPASYYVTVAGAPRNVREVKIEGNMVLLTLASSVGYTQRVVLSYTKPATGLVQDLSGNQAASLTNIEVANGYTSTNPVVSSGSASGNAVVLNFSEQLLSVSPYAYTQFTVNVGGTNYTPVAIWHGGNVVQLTISGTISSGQTVLVSYTQGSYPLIGISGNSVASFSNRNLSSSGGGGGGGVDTVPPQLMYITASGTLVTLKYNETLNPSRAPGAFQYSVVVDNQPRTISSVLIAGDSVILNLSSSVTANQTVRVSYVGTNNTVTDYSGNAAASFTNIVAGSGTGTGTGAPVLQGAILRGAVLTLAFNTVLDPSSVPGASQFLLRVNGLVRMVNNVQVSGTSVVLTLSVPANVGETAEISYFSTGTNIRSIGGVAAAAFTNTTVANQTTLLDTLTGDFEASPGGGVGIKTSAAVLMSDTSPAGVQANRYTVDNNKFITAVSTARNAGMTSPRVAFKVPDTERAALVALSITALEMASRQGDGVFAVEYGDTTFELPFRSLNYAELSRMIGGSGISSAVLIAIDRGASSLTSQLTTALGSSRAVAVAGPHHYDAYVVNGANKQRIENFSGYASRRITGLTGIDARQTAAVWLDPVTGTLSYVPTVFTTENGMTTATFKRKGNSAYALVRNSSSFNDIGNHWAADTVQMMARKFIVEGRSATSYEPDKPVTRGEFATYIAKGLGLAGNRAAAEKFKDVNTNTVMGAYIGAAAAAGIVNGVDSSTFRPNSFITRQDMAAMMMRAAKVAGMNVSLPASESTYLQNFADRGQVASYARTDVAQAIYLGIINGKSATRLAPTANATRAEGAVMIMRLLEKAEFLSQ